MARPGRSSTQDKIEIAVAIHIDKSGKPIVAGAPFVDGEFAVDEVMVDLEVGGGQLTAVNNGHSREPKEQKNSASQEGMLGRSASPWRSK